MKPVFAILLITLGLVSCTVATYYANSKLAEKFYDEGDYANAIQYYLKAVADRDQRAETFYWLGMSYYKHGDLEEAMFALERSFEKDSSVVVVTERLAAVNLDLGNLQKAAYYCRRAIRLNDEYIESYNTLGHIFVAGGEPDSAAHYFNYVLGLAKSLRWKAIASSTFESFAEPCAEANNGLGEICIARGSFFRALDYFGVANSLAREWETPWFNKGRVYEALGNTRAAEVAYQRTIDLAPGNTWAFKNLARMYRRLGRSSEAITLFDRAIRADSSDVECYYGLAELYQDKGDNRKAASIYEKAVDKAPNDPKAYALAGRANMLIGNYELAVEFLSGTAELQPGNADAHNNLWEAQRAAGDTAQAQKEFQKAIAADSLFTPALRNLGSMLLEHGKESEGFRYLFRAARLGDSNAAEFLRSRGLQWD